MLLLPASVTAIEAADTARLLEQSLQQETDAVVVVDASGLQRFDSAALAVLLGCCRAAQARGKSFAVRSVPAKLAALARLYGVEELLSGMATSRTADAVVSSPGPMNPADGAG